MWDKNSAIRSASVESLSLSYKSVDICVIGCGDEDSLNPNGISTLLITVFAIVMSAIPNVKIENSSLPIYVKGSTRLL